MLPEGSLHPLTLPSTVSLPETGRPGAQAAFWVVAALVGALAGGVLLRLVPGLQDLTARALPSLVPRAVVGGLVLGLMGALTSLALFSGHDGIQEGYDDIGELAAVTLVGLALVKAVAMLACLATGTLVAAPSGPGSGQPRSP